MSTHSIWDSKKEHESDLVEKEGKGLAADTREGDAVRMAQVNQILSGVLPLCPLCQLEKVTNALTNRLAEFK